MRHTLKAVFENRSDAQHVLEELIASGYTPADVALSDDTGETPGAAHQEGLGASVRHAFDRLFRSKHDADTAQPSGEALHNQHIIMFTTESEPEAARAAGIIGRFNPAGIEESHEQSDQFSADAYPPGAALGTVYPPGTEPGSLQFRSFDDGRYLGTQSASSPPHGDTYQDSMGGGTRWGHPDEMAAYSFGKDMGASDSYSDHSWDEAEPYLKIGWERRHVQGGAAAWHRVSEAVRQGWERVRTRRSR